MANNPFILNAIADTDMTADEETILIDQLKQQFSLNDASVANRKTADYWNQDGFLRRLTPQQDAWFFDFIQSGPERMLNVFTEQNGDVKLFVNFQQLNGLSMAGFSKSLDDMVSLLNGFRIEKTGFVYLMDGEGNIKIHKNSAIMGKQSISDVVGREEAAVLLKKQNFNLSRMDKNGKEIFIASHYIPSMAWFIVTEVPVDEVFESLHGSTQDIGSILDVIRGISDQTNLLALNAAIEAARAGEHGRGFAVVADEVRQLASRTSVSTDEIQKMIDQLQSEAKNAVDAMEASHAVTARGVKSADTATEVLAGIALSITDISDMNTQVATATEEQSTVVYTINQNIEEINGINELTTATAQELADSSQQLNSLSQRLDQLVGAFKV